MNKHQLIEALAKAEGLTLKNAEMIINEIFEKMSDALVDNNRIEVRGFGSFKVNHYGGYQGQNPKTKEVIEVKEKRLPFFKAGKELKDRVDGKKDK